MNRFAVFARTQADQPADNFMLAPEIATRFVMQGYACEIPGEGVNPLLPVSTRFEEGSEIDCGPRFVGATLVGASDAWFTAVDTVFDTRWFAPDKATWLTTAPSALADFRAVLGPGDLSDICSDLNLSGCPQVLELVRLNILGVLEDFDTTPWWRSVGFNQQIWVDLSSHYNDHVGGDCYLLDAVYMTAHIEAGLAHLS